MDTNPILPQNEIPPVSADNLPLSLQEALRNAHWQSLMPVQSLAIPYLLDGQDIMVQSRTGSGKTGCYLLPLLERISSSSPQPKVLILVPTRELAVQVEHEASVLFLGSRLSPMAIYGGQSFKKQVSELNQGRNVIIGTPGRILDHILHHTLQLSSLEELVLDEADKMLSIGFYQDIKEIQKALPPSLHTSLFSATYPPHVLRLAGEFMENPSLLSLSQKEVHVAEVQHLYCQVKHMDKDRALIRFLECENPSSAIIFCNTRATVHFLSQELEGFGYNAAGLSSDLSQSKRESILSRIRKGEIQYLVATDLASRGIDLPNLSHVFLYEPPEDRECYIHRAGRTGRAGSAGTVISLTDIMEEMDLQRIANYYHIDLRKIPLPSDGEVSQILSERLTALLETRYRKLTNLQKERIQRYIPLARALAEEKEESGMHLLAMLLDAFQRESLHQPNLIKDPEKKTPRKRKKSSHKKSDALLQECAPSDDDRKSPF